jgi:hypothetical protein
VPLPLLPPHLPPLLLHPLDRLDHHALKFLLVEIYLQPLIMRVLILEVMEAIPLEEVPAGQFVVKVVKVVKVAVNYV